ncbi:MAG TPA: EFR1 family ferrodoxin [Bacteroidales bacterium]|nr:EFR1 family ferrodoxin [Bacteroidales bacterium]
MTKFKSLYIYYISGTGNARMSSEWIADEARHKGISAVVQKIDRLENIEFPEPGKNTLIGFAFPTHGFNAAPIMLRFIASFPRGLCKEVFLLNTRAGMKMSKLFLPGISGVALLLPAFMLMIKGYRCSGFRPVDLPSNWIPLHPGMKEKVIRSIFERCEKIVRSFAGRILSGEHIYRGLRSLPLDILVSPVALGYYVAGRFFLSKTFLATGKCNNCGVCIRDCPTGSIRFINNRPYWSLTCESCMRCLNNCPQKAIETPHGAALVFWFIFSFINSQAIMLLIGFLNPDTDTLWWKLTLKIVSITCMILVTSLLYSIMHYALYFKPVRFLVKYTSLTALPFWRRYTFLLGKKYYTSQKHETTRIQSEKE